MIKRVALVCLLAAACRTRPVSVVVPEVDRDTDDLAPISAIGDTAWRLSAVADLREHAHGVQGVRFPTLTPHSDPGVRVRNLTPQTVNDEPATDELDDDEGPAVLRAQVLLDRAHFSVGVINGKAGQNTAKAIMFFQEEHDLPSTGKLDRATYDKLIEVAGKVDAAVQYTITAEDAAGPYYWVPVSVYEQEKLPCECYASAAEMLDERFHTVTDVLKKLNPGVGLNHITAGMTLWVPNVQPFDAEQLKKTDELKPIAKIHVAKNGRYLHALAADGSIVYHFPTTVGSEYDPSPTGKYRVTGVQFQPVFHYNPALYSDVPDSRPRATLPPGPNSPVGIVWIATSKEHVGIHGTPLPHTIGLASSHGCVRLTNWDAARLAAAIKSGVMIEFVN